MRVLMMIIGALILSACATLTESEREERQYRKVDWENRYVAYVNRCHRAGGKMILTRYSRVGRKDIPNPGDLYNCSTNVGRTPRP